MTNHVHLLLTPSTGSSCALLMRNLGQRYVQYFNRRYERSGTLWEGRYKSSLVDTAKYVVATYRYVERNPVRAKMVPLPAAYAWSSYCGNAGRALNKILTPHPEYLALANDEAARYEAYETLVAEEDEPAFLTAIRDATNGGFALVGERVKAALPPATQRRLQRRSPGPPPSKATKAEPPEELELEFGLRPRKG